MNELPIHDIKELSAIPDYSLYLFIAIIIVAIIIVSCTLFFIYKYFKTKNNSKKNALKVLQNIDFSDSKRAAYCITQYARVLVSSEREQKLFEELIEDLEQYKYKKEILEIKETSKQKFKIFMDAV